LSYSLIITFICALTEEMQGEAASWQYTNSRVICQSKVRVHRPAEQVKLGHWCTVCIPWSLCNCLDDGKPWLTVSCSQTERCQLQTTGWAVDLFLMNTIIIMIISLKLQLSQHVPSR